MRISLETALIGVISLIGAAIVYSTVMVSPAKAQTVSCTTYGHMTTCSGPGGTRTCTQYGSTVTCY